MNKGTHFLGQPMYGQLISLLDKAQILRISRENGGERYVKPSMLGSTWSLCSMLWSNASTRFAKSWHLCCPKPVNWDIWALTPCLAAPHSRMPTCAATNVSSKPFTESCTPLISTCFPRTADDAGVQSGSNACIFLRESGALLKCGVGAKKEKGVAPCATPLESGWTS